MRRISLLSKKSGYAGICMAMATGGDDQRDVLSAARVRSEHNYYRESYT